MMTRHEMIEMLVHLADDEVTLLFKEAYRELDRRYIDPVEVVEEVAEEIQEEIDEEFAKDDAEWLDLEDAFAKLMDA